VPINKDVLFQTVFGEFPHWDALSQKLICHQFCLYYPSFYYILEVVVIMVVINARMMGGRWSVPHTYKETLQMKWRIELTSTINLSVHFLVL